MRLWLIVLAALLIACTPQNNQSNLSAEEKIIDLNTDVRSELRTLWNEYDPIGVHSIQGIPGPKDEYDDYHQMIIDHLNKGSHQDEMFSDIRKLVTDYIGLTWNDRLELKTRHFVESIYEWSAQRDVLDK